MNVLIDRKLIVLCGLLGLAVAIADYASANRLYQYRTDLSLGEYSVGDNFQMFEPAQATEAFVRDTLLNAPAPEQLKQLGVDTLASSAIVVMIDAGKSARIVSTADEATTERARTIHRFLADAILDHLKRRVNFVKSRLTSQKISAEATAKAASEAVATLSKLAVKAQASETETAELVRALSGQISKAEPNEAAAPGGAEGSGNLLPSPGLRGQLAVAQKLRSYDLPLIRSDLAKSISSYSQTAAQQEQMAQDAAHQLEVLREPAVIVFALASATPIRPSFIVPFLLGLLAAFASYAVALAWRQRAKWGGQA